MPRLILASVLALSACVQTGPEEYDLDFDTAQSKLLVTDFERGIIPGSSLLKPVIMRNSEGALEWIVRDAQESAGWWCPILFEKAGEHGTKVRIKSQCKGLFAKDNRYLDELIDATLTGREINRDVLK